MLFFIVLCQVLCIAHGVDSRIYIENINTLIDTWIERPNPENYRNLQFYIQCNKPATPIIKQTEQGFERRLEKFTCINTQPYCILMTQCASHYVCYFFPNAWGTIIIGDCIFTGEQLRNYHQSNKRSLVQEIKNSLHHRCVESRRPKNVTPSSLVMSKK